MKRYKRKFEDKDMDTIKYLTEEGNDLENKIYLEEMSNLVKKR